MLLTALLLAGLIALLCILTACALHSQFGALPEEAEIRRFQTLPNYSNGQFHNLESVHMNVKKLARKPGFFRFLLDSSNAPESELPAVRLTRNSFASKPGEFNVTWLGHSMLIVELAGRRFLTDPVFGNAAPVPFVVRRYCDSPLPREELPPLDFILISHDHYDHLEYATIRFFRNSDVPFVVPLGVGAILRGWGIAPERIRELNWNDSIMLNEIRITALTNRHFSGRRLGNRNQTLWASFLFEGGGKKIYFGADGGYGKHFREIGTRYGPFDLTCLEIDAWNERWPHNHLFPDEVIQAQMDLRGKRLLPIHWGVFDLAMHPWDESIGKVRSLAEQKRLLLLTPKMGERIQPESARTTPWWTSPSPRDAELTKKEN